LFYFEFVLVLPASGFTAAFGTFRFAERKGNIVEYNIRPIMHSCIHVRDLSYGSRHRACLYSLHQTPLLNNNSIQPQMGSELISPDIVLSSQKSSLSTILKYQPSHQPCITSQDTHKFADTSARPPVCAYV